MKDTSDKMLQVILAVLAECAWRMDNVDNKYKSAFTRLYESTLKEAKKVKHKKYIAKKLALKKSARQKLTDAEAKALGL